MSVTVPIKILEEAEGHVVSVELTTGEKMRGKLVQSEENMNVELQDVTHRSKCDEISKKESVFIRGSQIRYFILPPLLRHATVFKKVSDIASERSSRPKRRRGGKR